MDPETAGAPRRSRRPQIPAVEARRRMLDAGVAFVDQHGLQLEFARIPLETLIEDAEVPRASAYRHWGTHADFTTELIRTIFDRPQYALNFSDETSGVIREALVAHRHLLVTAEGRSKVIRELIRLAAEHNFRQLLTSNAWQAYNTLYHVATSSDEPSYAETARAIERHFIDANAAIYQQVLDATGLRARPPHTARTIALAANTVVSGMANRIHVEPSIEDLYYDGPSIDGGETRWHYVAALARAAIEPLIEDPEQEKVPDQETTSVS